MSLVYAVEHGNMQRVRELISAGEDVNQRDAFDDFPLSAAACSGYKSIVEALITAGADVNKFAFKCWNSPLHLAALGGHEDCVRQLIDAGANVNVLNSEGESPLWCAVYNEHSDCASQLIKAGASVNTTNIYKNKPLMHLAVRQNDESTLRLLIRAGADVNEHDKWGKTPLMYAISDYYCDSIVRQLIVAGADVNAQATNSDRWPCVGYVVKDKYMLRLMLAGAKAHQHYIIRLRTYSMSEILRKYEPLYLLCYELLHNCEYYLACNTPHDITGMVLSYVFELEPDFCLYCLVYSRQRTTDAQVALMEQDAPLKEVCGASEYVVSSSSSKKRIAVPSDSSTKRIGVYSPL